MTLKLCRARKTPFPTRFRFQRKSSQQHDTHNTSTSSSSSLYSLLAPRSGIFGSTPCFKSQATAPLRSGPACDTQGPRRPVSFLYGEQAVNRAFLNGQLHSTNGACSIPTRKGDLHPSHSIAGQTIFVCARKVSCHTGRLGASHSR
jgi:hypothetical protein